MTTTTSRPVTREPILPANWHSERSFTLDQMFDMYLKGKKDGMEQEKATLKKTFESNLMRAALASQQIYEQAKSLNMGIKSINLRVDDLMQFTTLFIADKDDFVSPTFREVYKIARLVQGSSDSDQFHFCFSFTPESENFDEDLLLADGFTWKYNQEHKS